MLVLDEFDKDLLGGDYGPAAARAMSILKIYGEVVGADKFISIQSAHIDGCLYHGPSTIDFARLFVGLGGRVRVPTTLNVAAADTVHPQWHCGPANILSEQIITTALHEELGCVATLTCAPYHRLFRPIFGEHIAWAESNAIVFANSVLGARTDRYGDFTDLCAALTGRVPYAGLHRDENRTPQVAVYVVSHRQSAQPRDLYFAAIGYALGNSAAGRVPILFGLPEDASEEELKALGAAAASSGSIALFHAWGITPEARAWPESEMQAADHPPVVIEADDIKAVIATLCPLETGEPVAAMCLGTPHYSYSEFERLASVIRDRRAAANVDVFVSTSRETAAAIENSSMEATLKHFGVNIVVDTCTYLAPVVAKQGAIVTTSGKYAHYGPGNLQRRVGLMTLERCVRSAELGLVAPS